MESRHSFLIPKLHGNIYIYEQAGPAGNISGAFIKDLSPQYWNLALRVAPL